MSHAVEPVSRYPQLIAALKEGTLKIDDLDELHVLAEDELRKEGAPIEYLECAAALGQYYEWIAIQKPLRELGPQIAKKALELADLLQQSGMSHYCRALDPAWFPAIDESLLSDLAEHSHVDTLESQMREVARYFEWWIPDLRKAAFDAMGINQYPRAGKLSAFVSRQVRLFVDRLSEQLADNEQERLKWPAQWRPGLYRPAAQCKTPYGNNVIAARVTEVLTLETKIGQDITNLIR